MKRNINGREVRNALLSMAQNIHDDEIRSITDWGDMLQSVVSGTTDEILPNKEVVETVAKMVEVEPKMLRALSNEIGNYCPATLAWAIREYGKKYGLSLNRTAKGYQVLKTAC